jgi:O-methyltransferase involved in polyketide biosynthesis
VQVAAALEDSGIDVSKPTVILSECVLVYMKPEESNALISFLGGKFEIAAIVVRIIHLSNF